MLRKRTMVATLGLILGMDLAAEEGTKTLSEERERATFTLTLSEEGTDTYILNYKSEEEIVDVIWDEATITVSELRKRGVKALEKRATETVRIRYPKVVMVKDEETSYEYETFTKTIKFLDKRGRVKKEMALQRFFPRGIAPFYFQTQSRITLSKNRRYLCISTEEPTEIPEDYKGPIEDYKAEPEIESVILNTDGEVLWRVTHTLSSAWPSPNGKYIVGSNVEFGDYPVCVYNKDGLVAEIEKDDRMWRIDFSKDGSYFAILIITFDDDPSKEGVERFREHLIVIDENGNELWRKEDIAKADDCSWPGVNISEDDIITVTTGWPQKIYRFDKQGNLIESKTKEVER